ncbi:MAG: histidine kinase [Nitrospira bacterium SG8_35_1]|nr:MAG: histidine kinase [Nitrospira bacterium SG8_35_1]
MSATILFVDDEEYILNSINRLFSDFELDIYTANNADDAMKVLHEEEVAVIVTDNYMPGMMGVDLLEKISELSPDTMKIMMTGQADLTTAIAAINRGDVYRFITKPWDDDELIHTVTEAMRKYELVQSLKRDDEATLLSIAQTVELKDPYTRGHCERVSSLAGMMAEALQLDELLLQEIRRGSWLHDCGKIGVPERILNYPGPLDKDQYEVIKNHPKWGADVIRKAQLSKHVLNIVLYHHERYGGNGYPNGISGADIPIEARIVTVADVYDALTSARSYREKYCQNRAIEIMIMMKDEFFDPEILNIFIHDCLKFETA